MAGRSGVPSIIRLSRRICKLYKGRALALLPTITSEAFVAAIVALVAACEAFEALDDYPFEIDPND